MQMHGNLSAIDVTGAKEMHLFRNKELKLLNDFHFLLIHLK